MSRPATTYAVTLPDGRVETQQSVRPITHAVIGISSTWKNPERRWMVLTWTTKPESALRSAHSWNATAIKNKRPDAVRTELRLVPVVVSDARMEESMGRKAQHREPTPEEEGAQILESAAKAGTDYAQEQLNGDYFRDWVGEQMVEAEAMRQRDPNSVLPLEGAADARKLARNMLQQLEWDTKRDMDASTVLELSGAKGVFDVGSADWVRDKYGITYEDVSGAFFTAFDEELKSPSIRQWLGDLILELNEEVRKGGEVSEARRPHRTAEPDALVNMIDVFYRDGKLTDEITKVVSRGTSTRSPKRTVEPFDKGLRLRYGPIEREEYRHLEGALYRKFGNAVRVSLVSYRPSEGPNVGEAGTKQTKWDVYLRGRQITSVFYDPSMSADEVRRSLVDHDGLDPAIVVRKHAAVREGQVPTPRRPVVRDYIAVNPSGRPVAGPFTDYSEAKREADRVRGYVRFASSAHESRRTRRSMRPRRRAR